MRLAVFAACEAAGAVLDAIARGIGERRLAGLDHEFEFTAGTSAMAAVTSAVGAKFVAAEMQGKSHLLYLDTAELDAAGGLPFASPRPTVASRRAATARPRLKQMP